MSVTTVAELIDRARTDTDFRQRALDDLEGTLTAEGYELSGDELQAARQLHRQAQEMRDEDINAALKDEVTGHARG